MSINNAYKDIGLALNTWKNVKVGRHQGMLGDDHIRIDTNSYEKVKTFKYLGSLLTKQKSIQEEIKCRFKAGN